VADIHREDAPEERDGALPDELLSETGPGDASGQARFRELEQKAVLQRQVAVDSFLEGERRAGVPTDASAASKDAKEAGGTDRVEPVRLRESDLPRARGTGFWAGGGGRPRDCPVAFQSTVLRIESLSHRRWERITSSIHHGYHRLSKI